MPDEGGGDLRLAQDGRIDAEEVPPDCVTAVLGRTATAISNSQKPASNTTEDRNCLLAGRTMVPDLKLRTAQHVSQGRIHTRLNAWQTIAFAEYEEDPPTILSLRDHQAQFCKVAPESLASFRAPFHLDRKQIHVHSAGNVHDKVRLNTS